MTTHLPVEDCDSLHSLKPRPRFHGRLRREEMFRLEVAQAEAAAVNIEYCWKCAFSCPFS